MLDFPKKEKKGHDEGWWIRHICQLNQKTRLIMV